MPLVLTPARAAVVADLRDRLMRGQVPLIEHSLIAETSTALAAATTGTPIVVNAYEDGLIVSIDAMAYAAGGDAEADTMHPLTHHKYAAAWIKFCGRPKTNDTYEPLYLLAPHTRYVCWVAAANDQLSVTFKHLATAGIADLQMKVKFGFIPFSELGV